MKNGEIKTSYSYMSFAGLKERETIVVGRQLQNISTIKESVCAYYGKDKSAVYGKGRHKGVMEARQVTAYLLRKHTRLSLVEIAGEIGKKSLDHSTAWHSIQHIKILMENEPQLANVIDAIETRFL